MVHTIRQQPLYGCLPKAMLRALRGDVHTQVVTDNGKRPFRGEGVLHQRVISGTKWHYRNNITKISIKQVFRKKNQKKRAKNKPSIPGKQYYASTISEIPFYPFPKHLSPQPRSPSYSTPAPPTTYKHVGSKACFQR